MFHLFLLIIVAGCVGIMYDVGVMYDVEGAWSGK